ncbi:MAG: mechanosensitive ion channel [Methanothrix sp.]|nr:mechanosensitive ion channel [Methanothrix sp.]
MNLTAMAGMTDPILLANWIQQSVDSMTGRHVDLVFVQILANTIRSIDLAFIFVSTVVIIIIALLTRTAVRIVDRMLVNYIPTVVSKVQMKMDETMQLMIRRLFSATIYVIGLILIISQVPQLRSLATAMLAGAGIAGLAIGYAAKDSLSNFTSSVFIAVFQPFRVGDSVDFRGEYGQVEDLTLRHTVIRTTDNKRIIVPNSIMNMEPIINWSIREPEITWMVDFDLEKASDIDC